MATVYKSIFTGPEIGAKLSERVPSTPSGSPSARSVRGGRCGVGYIEQELDRRFRDGYFQQCDDPNIQSVAQCIE